MVYSMEKEVQIKNISNIILESIDEVADLLRTIGSPNRLRILSFLVQKSRTFSFLLNHLLIKRTTLVHHIDVLIDTHFIERQERGKYMITDDGNKFLKVVTDTYQNLIMRKENKLQELIHKHNHWPHFYREPMLTHKNHVTNKGLFQGGWNSFISSITGILVSLGVPHDHVYISGRIGSCFIVNTIKILKSSMAKEMVSESAWRDIYKGIESFGWKLTKKEINRKYPGNWKINNEDADLALEVFNQIVKIIDDYNTPVVLLGIHGCCFAIVNGYQNDSYLVSTFYRMEDREEIPIKFDQLNLLDKFMYFYLPKKIETNDLASEEKESINRAIKFTKGEDYSQNGFIMGPSAYDEWINVLELEKKEKIDLYSNSILGQYYFDSKYVASEYLERLSRKYINKPQAEPLKKASEDYRNAKIQLEQFTILFPYFELEKNILSKENRKKGVNIIREVKKYETMAIDNLEIAYEKWE